MGTLSFIEKQTICRLFGISDGYIFKFWSDRGSYNKNITQELICKGWFLPPNTYDCGSFVVNGTAVVGKE